jgi:hypothetical protein
MKKRMNSMKKWAAFAMKIKKWVFILSMTQMETGWK